MKTTKKRLLLGISGAAILCTGAVFTTLSATAEPQITDETMLTNIEALSSGEGSTSSDCMETMGYNCYGGGSLSVKCANLISAGDR